jgi:hypothetical protein
MKLNSHCHLVVWNTSSSCIRESSSDWLIHIEEIGDIVPAVWVDGNVAIRVKVEWTILIE